MYIKGATAQNLREPTRAAFLQGFSLRGSSYAKSLRKKPTQKAYAKSLCGLRRHTIPAYAARGATKNNSSQITFRDRLPLKTAKWISSLWTQMHTSRCAQRPTSYLSGLCKGTRSKLPVPASSRSVTPGSKRGNGRKTTNAHTHTHHAGCSFEEMTKQRPLLGWILFFREKVTKSDFEDAAWTLSS